MTKNDTIEQVLEMTAGNVEPEFYFSWGNEPAGYVTIGCYMDDIYQCMGFLPESEAKRIGLKYHCPHS